MRVLFLISDAEWSARARAFVLAARGLSARGHEVLLACQSECPVQARVSEAELPVLKIEADASSAGAAWQLRNAMQQRAVDVVFVHTDAEMLIATSAAKLGGGAGAVIRRVPPFEMLEHGRGARLANLIGTTGLLFSTEADREAAEAKSYRLPVAVAPVGVDPADYESVRDVPKASIGVPTDSVLIACVYDGVHRSSFLTVLRTLSLLAPRHPELHLAVIGAARQDDVRMHAAALGITAMVTCLGARTDELAIIRGADVGWVAAEGDAAAFAALDFMACRIPVLAERNALTEHYVADGIAGVLLAPADPTTTAASVAAFLAKETQRKAMGNAGRTRLQREFTLDAMILGFEQAMSRAGDRSMQPAR